ncbi:hypothetical protein C1J03_01185 [Sulfitobacter sp. SK012]|uniref:DUF2793 domain-containing protein n=1 Tax=Sulfitobacter sp. SK012 TaxID=1389005 RepID=UPI000E0A32E0|nr:DUF2793 domain-containing protein [Sulfitobacter sp. SK012]AXI44766.1 hypothetical protein C1J03_01185 [Sulfitobacter sp. SK012]
MPDRSPILNLPFILPSQAQKHVTHNEALRRLDVVVQLVVQSVGATDPPSLPVEGQAFALGPSPNGAWASQGGSIAAYLDGAWYFVTPHEGWRAWDSAAQLLRAWNGTLWAAVGGGTENLPRLGVNATADNTNRLNVSSEATLLNHAGMGHQLKINKRFAGNTASLLYQTSFSGRAEMGLNGSDAFSIKVSDDGNAWNDALVFDPQNGTASGTAIQGATDDTTAQRLLRVGSFGLGNRVVRYNASDDLDGLRDLSALVGNTLNNAVPVNSPTNNGAFVGLTAALNATRGAQFMIETVSDQGAFFRVDNNGWSDWRRVVDSGNMVGTVSQDAGTPTGAVIESGNTANGDYIRYADGTQWATNSNAPITTAPAAFVGTITKIDSDKLWIGRWF